MSQQAPNSDFSADKETRSHVTPFAFGAADSLLGVKLATPRRRLWAILVDLACVGILAQLSVTWLSVMVLLVVMNAYSHIRNEPGKAWAKTSLFAAMSVAILILLTQLAVLVFSNDDEAELPVEPRSALTSSDSPSGKAFNLKAFTFKDSSIGNYGNETGDNAEFLNELTYRNSDYSLVLSTLSNDDGVICEGGDKCGEDFFIALSKDLFESGVPYEAALTAHNEIKVLLHENGILNDEAKSLEFADLLYKNMNSSQTDDEDKPQVSLLSWLQGLLSDLGLSFGWAAVYFSSLTAWWNGQTLGKRLFGIRVVRIDAKPIDLWESVGRYGGYSAGLATGLLGFAQIYWDSNRQTIQDKISETLVVEKN